MTDKNGIIRIGSYPIDDHARFSEALTCLSHALGALDMFLQNDLTPEVKANIWALELIISTTYDFSEAIEERLFGGEFDLKKQI